MQITTFPQMKKLSLLPGYAPARGDREGNRACPIGGRSNTTVTRMLGLCMPASTPTLTVSTPTLTADAPGGDIKPIDHVPTWKRVAHYMMHSLHLVCAGIEMANVATGVALGGAIGSTIVSVGMMALGVSHVADGVKNKSGEQVMEGIGAGLVGVQSGLEAVVLGSAHGHGFLASTAHAMHGAITPLGIAHGGAEVVMGLRSLYIGARYKDSSRLTSGALTVGLGSSVVAATLGCGLPAIVCAGGFLAGRIAWEERNNFRAVLNGKTPPPIPTAQGWRFLDR